MFASNDVTEEQLRTLPLTNLGIDYIIRTSQSPPAKSVKRSRKNNLVGHTPLIENQVSLQHQSDSGENLFLAYLQHRRDLWGVYDQPTTVAFDITAVNKQLRKATYTPDFLVVDEDGATVYEIKEDSKLKHLCMTRPADWIRDETGYRYLAAERYFAKLGIKHKTIANSELSPVRASNIRLICSHRLAADTDKLRKQKYKARKLVHTEGSIKASDLQKRLELRDLTAVLQLIDEGEIFAPLDLTPLEETNHLWLASTQQEADERTTNDQRLSQILREQRVIGSDELPEGDYIGDIAVRYAVLEGKNTINPRKKRPYSARSIRRFKKALRDANGDILSLTPKWDRCGNHESRLSTTHRALIVRYIRDGRSNTNDPSIASCWRAYKDAFEQHKAENDEIDERSINQSTFQELWHSLPGQAEDALQKGGRRLANAVRPVYDAELRITRALRAFEAAHIDHWNADFFVYVTTIDDERIALRPWVTAMIDGKTNEILALWMSFDAPSKKANCMVIRECVLRHGRLPEIIVTDGGSDFASDHFSVMLAVQNIAHLERPPENPGFGHEIEALFGVMREQFAKGLPGFVFSIEQGRAISAAFKAARKATLDLEQASELIKLFAYTCYNNSVHPSGHIQTRIDLRRSSLEMFPMSGRLVVPDLRFMIITAIDASVTTYKLYPRRGVHVNNVWFTHPRLLAYSGYKKDVRVRIEPYDPSIVYVSVKDKWFVCYSSQARINASKSDDSLLSAGREKYELSAIRKEFAQKHSMRAAKIVNDKLREIMSAVSAKEAIDKSTKSKGKGSTQGCEASGHRRGGKWNVPFDELAPYE